MFDKNKNVIIAIDPGNEQSGYVVVSYDDNGINEVLDFGKVVNEKLYSIIAENYEFEETHVAIEMIQSFGMPVGVSVFETCVWIGRLMEYADSFNYDNVKRIYRQDEKLILCGTKKAKDASIRQALVDIYAPNEPNYGKGTKASPGFFYGFKADVWQAMAVAHCYFEKYLRKGTQNADS